MYDINTARYVGLIGVALTLLGGCQWQRSTQRQHLYASPMLAPAPDGFGHELLMAQLQTQRERQDKRTRRSERLSSRRAPRRSTPRQEAIPRATVAQLSPKRAPSPSQGKRALPSLSSTRQVKDTAPPHKLEPARDQVVAGSPAQAAAYIWRYHNERGVTLPSETRDQLTALYKHCKKRKAIHFKTPEPGQIVFFHNTVDLNGDGRHNDWYTYAAIVSARDGDQLNLMSAQDSSDNALIAMNLRHPKATKRGEQTINTQLRPRRSDDLPFTQYLSGELYAGACALAR